MNAAGLFPKPRSDAARAVASLAARLAELKAEARALRAKEAAGGAAMAEAAQALRAAAARHRAFNDQASALKAAEATVAKLEKSGAGLADEVRLTADAVGHVELEMERTIRDHADELMAELHGDAVAAAERLSAGVREVQEAHGVYVAAGNRTEALLRIVDADRLRAERLPPIPASLTALAQDPGAAAVPVPVLGAPGSSVLSTA